MSIGIVWPGPDARRFRHSSHRNSACAYSCCRALSGPFSNTSKVTWRMPGLTAAGSVSTRVTGTLQVTARGSAFREAFTSGATGCVPSWDAAHVMSWLAMAAPAGSCRGAGPRDRVRPTLPQSRGGVLALRLCHGRVWRKQHGLAAGRAAASTWLHVPLRSGRPEQVSRLCKNLQVWRRLLHAAQPVEPEPRAGAVPPHDQDDP